MEGAIMTKLALNFICKNESHVIRQMLKSALPITDLIVAVDTGSTDNTIALIHDFGKENSVPTFVFERPFDNFCNSRNHALDKLKEVIHDLQWKRESTWGFYIDCDDILEFTDRFSKEDILCDFYFICVKDGNLLDTRQFFFNLSKDFYWEGPIHEFIKSDGPVSQAYLKDLRIIYRHVGASWKIGLEKKYLNYAEKLIQYINEGNRSFRWLYYAGECFAIAADECKPGPRKQKWLLEAQRYYERASAIEPKTLSESYMAYAALAEIKLNSGDQWNEARELLLKAYTSDKRHAEPLLKIIKTYTKQGLWEIAYLFSSFAISNYHEKLPLGFDITDVQPSVYQWELLFYHILICSSTGRMQESKLFYLQLKSLLNTHKANFSGKELLLIRLLLWQEKLKRLFVRTVPS
jgi:glycosyltransferase involved in cell wall biosynthesis